MPVKKRMYPDKSWFPCCFSSPCLPMQGKSFFQNMNTLWMNIFIETFFVINEKSNAPALNLPIKDNQGSIKEIKPNNRSCESRALYDQLSHNSNCCNFPHFCRSCVHKLTAHVACWVLILSVNPRIALFVRLSVSP